MTVSEAELRRRAAEKGRSASLCASGQLPLALPAAHSSTDVQVTQQVLMKAAANGTALQFKTPIKCCHSARRSQSCRVTGSRPPRATRRHGGGGTPQGSTGGLERGSEPKLDNKPLGSLTQGDAVKGGSYNSFLKKVGSCGRLVTLAPDEDADGSPVLRRTASARRPRPPSSPTHSPTPTRVTRAAGSVKGRTPSRKGLAGASAASGGNSSCGRRQGGGGAAAASSSSYLEVRTTGSSETLDPDACLLRNFSTTNKGIVNRGDSFRRRRSRSNSIQPPHEPAILPSALPRVGGGAGAGAAGGGGGSDIASMPGSPEISVSIEDKQHGGGGHHSETATEHFRVAVVGATGVGKTALMNQFRTSECINAYDCNTDLENPEETVLIVLNAVESEITFINITAPSELQEEMSKPVTPNGWLVVYSITDKSSLQRANDDLTKLQTANLLKGRVTIVVGNKCDLVRSRAVSFDDGRDLACSFNGKFMEISVGMNHKCDDLLVGILNQLRLKDEMAHAAAAEGGEDSEDKEKTPWTRNKSLMRASMKAKKLVNRIIGKSDSKLKQCEDFLN